MSISRKEFIRKASLSGTCLCGFTSLVIASEVTKGSIRSTDNQNSLQQEWVSVLLSGLESSFKDEAIRKILKPCSLAHYKDLKMDDILTPYQGNIKEFCRFLSDSWGWKVDFDEKRGIILGNENKEQCVCPMVNHSIEGTPSAICYCSEGFTEKMFSFIIGKPVSARVVSSILRGDKTCVYEVRF